MLCRFGEDSSTYRKGYEGGIFQMDSIGFKDTQNTASHPGTVWTHSD